ncbi:GNAT family N-acetyltransferase [Virgibacillus salarius]|uniref:GNAT family N-acetyltransferase n=1 Tax=Virgibacillus salarius TaxID=447199 RepID=UPI002490800A|nr:GNAT family N-acetyltransferase [Virgibacillus salarius]WBX81676.1 GNAT family N-acetyltransferase [Virgibacillus salarius]
MMEVKQACKLEKSVKRAISSIFVDGFGEHLTFFSKDRETLITALEHMFVTEVFYVAIIDGEIAGITACTDGHALSVHPIKQKLRKHLGFYKGTFAYYVFKREFKKPPIETGPGKASIEFVATAPQYRGKGVARDMIEQLLALPTFTEYILEVADTNTKAMNLYTKLGFKEFTMKKQSFSKISGINYRVYMKYTTKN